MNEESIIFYSGTEIDSIPIVVFSTHKGIRRLIFKKLPASKLKINPLKLQIDDPLMYNIFEQLTEYFEMNLKKFDVPTDIVGTTFQQSIWAEINKIKYGETTTYKELGENIGYSGGSQAVGNAVGANPLPIIIPCHRVLGQMGKLTGYSGGLPIKRKLLEIEGILTPDLF